MDMKGQGVRLETPAEYILSHVSEPPQVPLSCAKGLETFPLTPEFNNKLKWKIKREKLDSQGENFNCSSTVMASSRALRESTQLKD